MQVHQSKQIHCSKLSCSRQCSREVLSTIWSNQSCLILVVGVLYVLGKPVLRPVDLLTSNWNLEVIQDDPELVVLHLVVHAVVLGHSTVPLLLILEVVPHSLLQDVETQPEFGQTEHHAPHQACGNQSQNSYPIHRAQDLHVSNVLCSQSLYF